MGADIFVGITIYQTHEKVVSAGPWKHSKPPHKVLAPESTLTRVNSSRVNSHSPLCQLVPCVNSSPSQLVLGSTRPRVNSNPRTRPRVNSSSSQLVPRSTRPRVNSRLHLSLVNLHPRQLAPTSTRTRVIPQPSQLAPRSSRTQVPAYHTTHLPIYLHYLPPT